MTIDVLMIVPPVSSDVLRPSRLLARGLPHDEKGNDPKQIQPIPVANDELGPPEKRVGKDELSGEFVVGLRGEGKLAEREILGQRKHSYCRAPSDRETTVERLPTDDECAEQRAGRQVLREAPPPV